MFEIFVKNLVLYGYHGVNPEEKKEGQDFLFNVQAKVKKDSFKGEDNIENTVNYSQIIDTIKNVNKNNKFDLLETFAEKISGEIFKISSLIKEVKVKIEKIKPPINENLESVGVSYKLKRDTATEDISDSNFKASNKLKKSEKYNSIYLSLGTNIGNRFENLKNAINAINSTKIFQILKISSIYETEPMYVSDQENFYNIVILAKVRADLNPFVIFGYLKGIEYLMGRKKQKIKNGPRIIDIDILSIDEITLESDLLILPHPKLKERNFVLIPLLEIAPAYNIGDTSLSSYIAKKKFPEKVKKINQIL